MGDANRSGWRTFDFVQRPGEVVYTPVGWWHAVLNLEASVAVTHNVMSYDVFQKVIHVSGDPFSPIKVTENMVHAAVSAFELDDRDGEVCKWLEKLLFAQWLESFSEDN